MNSSINFYNNRLKIITLIGKSIQNNNKTFVIYSRIRAYSGYIFFLLFIKQLVLNSASHFQHLLGPMISFSLSTLTLISRRCCLEEETSILMNNRKLLSQCKVVVRVARRENKHDTSDHAATSNTFASSIKQALMAAQSNKSSSRQISR